MVKYCMTPLLMELKLIIIIIAANKIHVYRHQRRRLAQNLYQKISQTKLNTLTDLVKLLLLIMELKLIIIIIIEKTITYYDSGGDDGTAIRIYKGTGSSEYNTINIFELLPKYLRQEHDNKKKRPWNDAGWKDVMPRNTVPQQRNGSDCGVFASQFINYLATNDAFDFTRGRHAPHSPADAVGDTGRRVKSGNE